MSPNYPELAGPPETVIAVMSDQYDNTSHPVIRLCLSHWSVVDSMLSEGRDQFHEFGFEEDY